eukprot:6376229-Amphidinium_carterae.1
MNWSNHRAFNVAVEHPGKATRLRLTRRSTRHNRVEDSAQCRTCESRQEPACPGYAAIPSEDVR